MLNRLMKLSNFVGQEKIIKQLEITMKACKKMEKPMPHILLSGDPGLGKSTIAKVLAEEQGVNIYEIMGSNIKSIYELEDTFVKLNDHKFDILLIDEIHRLPKNVEESLYLIMEDFIIEVDVKGDHGRKSIEKFWVPPFTLIGTTTLAGDVSKPLRDRFGISFTLQKYNEIELSRIISNLSLSEGHKISKQAVEGIAQRSKGTARIAINYYNRCKEYALYLGTNKIDSRVTREQFELLGIDTIGLNEEDYKILDYLALQKRPIGIDTISLATSIDKNTVKLIIEPYLIQNNLIQKTRSGREITAKGLEWLNNKH